MALSEEVDFRKHLEGICSGSIASLYLLHGEEDYLQNEFWCSIKDSLIIPETSSFNLEYIDGETCSAIDVINAVETPSFLGGKKCVLVRRAHQLEKEVELLVHYFANPNDLSCLVLLSEPLKASSKLLKSVHAGGTVIPTPFLKGNKLSAAVKRLASRRSLILDDDALSLLVEQTGGSLWRASAEIEKISLYMSSENRKISSKVDSNLVPLEMVADIVDDGRTDNLFQLTDAIGVRDIGKALGALEVLLHRQNYPTVIIASMARHLMRLLEARSLLDEGTSPSKAPSKMNGSPYYIRKLVQHARRFSDGELRRALSCLHDADGSLRGSGTPSRLLMENVVFELCKTSDTKKRKSSPAVTHAPYG